MEITKMHGCGNSYVCVDGARFPVKDPCALSRLVSDPRFGIGSDGLILILPSKKADFRMRMFNADGSEGQMCGNGVRCIAKYVFEHGLTKKKVVALETIPGIVTLDLLVKNGKVEQVKVDMGPLRTVPPAFHVTATGKDIVHKVKLQAGDRTVDGHVVSIGNPHCVIFVDDTETYPVEKYGPLLERHPDFPERCNIEFVDVKGARVRQRTWERGSGETWACGTGACAVAVTLHQTRGLKKPVRIDLRGGRLTVEIRDGRIYKTGPAVEVFTARLSDDLIKSAAGTTLERVRR